MKKIFYLLSLIPGLLIGQDSNYDFNKIQLNVAFADQLKEKVPEEALELLKTRIQTLVVKTGFGSSDINPQFFVTPKVNVLTKNVTPTAPSLITQEIEVTLFTIDYNSGTIYHQASVTITGIGETETKSYISGFKKISPENEKFNSFMEVSRKKIIEFYNLTCNDRIQKIQDYMNQSEYQKALELSYSVPYEVTECRSQLSVKIIEAYKKYSEKNCKENLQKAKSEFAIHNYASSIYYLSIIDPESSCSKESLAMLKQIESKITEKERKDWEFAYEQYKDSVKLEQMRIKNSQRTAKSGFQSFSLLNLLGIFSNLFK